MLNINFFKRIEATINKKQYNEFLKNPRSKKDNRIESYEINNWINNNWINEQCFLLNYHNKYYIYNNKVENIYIYVIIYDLMDIENKDFYLRFEYNKSYCTFTIHKYNIPYARHLYISHNNLFQYNDIQKLLNIYNIKTDIQSIVDSINSRILLNKF